MLTGIVIHYAILSTWRLDSATQCGVPIREQSGNIMTVHYTFQKEQAFVYEIHSSHWYVVTYARLL